VASLFLFYFINHVLISVYINVYVNLSLLLLSLAPLLSLSSLVIKDQKTLHSESAVLQIFPLFPYFKALTPKRQNNIMELYVMHTKKQTFHLEEQSSWGAGIAQWLESRTRD